MLISSTRLQLLNLLFKKSLFIYNDSRPPEYGEIDSGKWFKRCRSKKSILKDTIFWTSISKLLVGEDVSKETLKDNSVHVHRIEYQTSTFPIDLEVGSE